VDFIQPSWHSSRDRLTAFAHRAGENIACRVIICHQCSIADNKPLLEWRLLFIKLPISLKNIVAGLFKTRVGDRPQGNAPMPVVSAIPQYSDGQLASDKANG
jgi:hypothetical protein